MSSYSEDQIIELSAIEVFVQDLNYSYIDCYKEKLPDTLGRETKSEVVLITKLTEAITKLNTSISEDAKKLAIEELLKDRSTSSLVKANKEIYHLVKEGVKIKIKNSNGEYEYRTIKVVDFDNPKNNDFFLVSQFWITGEIYTRRPDIICFVNGLPIVIIEFKARGIDINFKWMSSQILQQKLKSY
jgi:type I restriction enzyme, R subunit